MRLRNRNPFEDALLVLAPVATLALLVSYVAHHHFAFDFEQTFWVVGHRLVTGSRSPYSWTQAQIQTGPAAFPYPALTGLLFLPFGLFPLGVGAAVWVTLSMAAVVAVLRVLSVRDWRLYPLVFLWWPVIIAWQSANMTLVLALLLALVWRYRDRPTFAGLLTAVLISLKPVAWPVGLWLLATRRYRASAWAVAWGLVVNLIAWSIVGFDQIRPFIRLDATVTSALYKYGYGIISLAVRLGASRTDGTVVMVVISAALAALCIRLARRGREAPALLIAVDLTLFASPLVWNHYFALLIVPLAILRPRIGLEWVLPLLLWLCPGGLREAGWQVVLFAAVTAVTTYVTVQRSPDRAAAQAHSSEQRRSVQPHVLALPQGGERAG